LREQSYDHDKEQILNQLKNPKEDTKENVVETLKVPEIDIDLRTEESSSEEEIEEHAKQ
jgi:sortase (surface protein transpeptidase)